MNFEHEQVCGVRGLDGDPAALGGAVTVRLCGHWEHEGPCRWPHHSDSVEDGDVWFTTVRFNAAEDEVESVRAMISSVLARGSIVGPDGRRTTWGSFG